MSDLNSTQTAQNEQIEQVVLLCSGDKCALASQNIPYIVKNIAPKTIFVITAAKNFGLLQKIKEQTPNLQLVDEDTMYQGLNFSSVKALADDVYGEGQKRTGWYFQQFLKMAWAFNPLCAQNYLVWDCDTFPLQKICLTWNGKRVFNIKSEVNLAYFETLEAILGIKKQIAGSFISEFMYFEQKIMQQMVQQIENNANPNSDGTNSSFFQIIMNAVKQNGSPKAGFSEFETYGSYMYANFPQNMTFTSIPTMRNGANYCGMKPKKWQLWYIGRNHVTASFESWSKPHKLRIFGFNLFSWFFWLVKS